MDCTGTATITTKGGKIVDADVNCPDVKCTGGADHKCRKIIEKINAKPLGGRDYEIRYCLCCTEEEATAQHRKPPFCHLELLIVRDVEKKVIVAADAYCSGECPKKDKKGCPTKAKASEPEKKDDGSIVVTYSCDCVAQE